MADAGNHTAGSLFNDGQWRIFSNSGRIIELEWIANDTCAPRVVRRLARLCNQGGQLLSIQDHRVMGRDVWCFLVTFANADAFEQALVSLRSTSSLVRLSRRA